MDSATDWTRTPFTPDLVRGALDLERTGQGLLPHRLPARARAQCADEQLAMAEAQPAGVRLVFRTRATVVELDTLRTTTAYEGVPPGPDGLYDLLVDGRLAGQASVSGGNARTMGMAEGIAEERPGPVGTVRFTGLPDRQKDVEIWLPYNEMTRLVALRTAPPSNRCRTGGARSGCITAVRSVRGRSPRAPARRGRYWPPRWAGWS